MSDMVERMAKAIQVDEGSPCISILKLKLCRDADGCICRSLARAAIEAMREPTVDMVAVGMMAGTGLGFADPDETWTTMIDAALKEQP